MIDKQYVYSIFRRPLPSLLAEAHEAHQKYFPGNKLRLARLLSVKTGGCPENCAYCPQSAHHATTTARHGLLSVSAVTAAARAQKEGAGRFCLGAAWREVKDGPEFDQVLEMVKAVRGLGLEVCCTLGMLTESQAARLKEAGLHAYNHNIDTSRNLYPSVVSTRVYEDRLRTIDRVRKAGITVCTGGILGLGESEEDRVDFLFTLAGIKPESVTINTLVPVTGTPLANAPAVPALQLVRVVAVARLLLPESVIRLSAGREALTDEAQFLCFFAGANSVFTGDRLLTRPNPSRDRDEKLFRETGYQAGERP